MPDLELFEVSIKGSAPYGFRLFGGEGDPLIVAKLRARSKAHDADLREGDVVLGINGRSCETMSHGIAMALLESAGDSLRLHLYRGGTDKASVQAAYQAVANQLRPVSPGTVPPSRSIFTIQPNGPSVQPPAEAPAAEPAAEPSAPKIASEPVAEPASTYSKQEVTSAEGHRKETVTTETHDLGGVTLTKVTREVVVDAVSSITSPPADAPADVHKASMFHVPKVKARPLFWSPEGKGTAEPGKTPGSFQVNKIITVDIASHPGKENLTPNVRATTYGEYAKVPDEPLKFKVYKTAAKPSVWRPEYVPELPTREQSLPLTFERLEAEEAKAAEAEEAPRRHAESDREGIGGDLDDELGLTSHLIKVLTTEGPSEDLILRGKKKIFADSSFYDTADHTYPTIEEQIKMARKVAHSLSAPDNTTARGQRMFLKRKKKANTWSSEYGPEDEPTFSATLPRSLKVAAEHHSLYYNPAPWKTPRNKTGGFEPLPKREIGLLEGSPEDLEASSVSFAKNRALFQRGVDQETKAKRAPPSGAVRTAHGDALINDLKSLKGRGAKMFAQRRAKAAEDENEGWQYGKVAPEVGLPWGEQIGSEAPEPTEDSAQASASRLEQLITISKAATAPWESRATNLEPWKPGRVEGLEEDSARKGGAGDSWRPVSQYAPPAQTPSFLVQRPNVAYRPVKFHAIQDLHEYGITDF